MNAHIKKYIALGLGYCGRDKKVKLFPTENLTGRYIQYSEGEDLIDLLGGVSIPFVSGSGLNQIFDFSVLNDDRFDKGARIGNSLGLPEYYNDPLDAYFYYDGTSQQTRRYWKLKDFHYFYMQQQTDITPRLLNNWCFLKAKATSNTSNEINTIQELLIYSTWIGGTGDYVQVLNGEQTEAALTKLRKYIGIQDDFYGDELVLNSNLENWTNDDPDIYTISNESVNNYITENANGARFVYDNDNPTTLKIITTGNTLQGKTYRLNINLHSVNIGRIYAYNGLTEWINRNIENVGDNISLFSPDTSAYLVIYRATETTDLIIRFISLKQFYQNYYKS